MAGVLNRCDKSQSLILTAVVLMLLALIPRFPFYHLAFFQRC